MLQKTDPKLESNNYLRIENDSYFVSVFDLSTDKSLKTLNEKLSNVKEIEQQLTNLTAKLKLVYDFEPSVKKLYLVVIYQDFYLNNYHEMTTIISKSKHLNVININEVVARNEDLCKAINENNSIKKAVFELHDDNLIFKVLDNLKLNNNIQTLCMKDLKLSGDSLKEIFSSFFSSNTSLTSLNLIKNKIDQNVNGIEVLNGLLVNSKTPLKKLNLTNNVIKSENFAKNLGEILKNKELTKLKLGRCQLNNLEIFSNLYNYIHPSKLQILDLSFNYIDLNLISDFIVNNLNINKLILQKIRTPKNSDFKRFGNVFISSQSLKYLGFYYDIIDDNNNFSADTSRLIDFYNGFAVPPGCGKSYKTYKMELTPDIMSQFANIVGANDCFTEVDFSLCIFKEKSFPIFLSAFANSTKLESLIIDSINVEADDLKAFAQFISSSKSINKFNLSNTKISTEDLNLVGDAIAVNQNIKSISLSNSMDEETDPIQFLTKISTSSLEEIDFSFCDGKGNYSEAFGKLLDSCLTLKRVKVGRKMENFEIKFNNNLFNITNKLNLESLEITNIKFEGISMKNLILNSDKLKSLSLSNSTNRANFIKFFVEKNQSLDYLSFSFLILDEEEISYMTKLIYLVKKLKLIAKNLEILQLDAIFDSLINNYQIEHFELLFANLENSEYVNSIRKYYKNALTCNLLSNLMIFNIPEDTEQTLMNSQLQEKSKTIILEFAKSLNMN